MNALSYGPVGLTFLWLLTSCGQPDAGSVLSPTEPEPVAETNSESMADQLFTLLNQPELKKRLITAGKKRIEYFNSFKRDEILLEILMDFRTKRKCWK